MMNTKYFRTTLLRSVITCFIGIAFSSSSLADSVVPTERVTNGVKIREGTSSHSAQLGMLKPGEQLEWIANVPHWREVRLPDGRRGFVSKSFTRVIADSAVPSPDLHIHFLNSGTGSCAILECPGENAPPMIIDCGSISRSSTDLDKNEVRGYIQEILNRHSGVVPNLVLSHPDRDHYNLIPHVLTSEVDTILLGGDPNNYSLAGFLTWIQDKESNGTNIISEFEADFHTHHDTDTELPCGEAAAFILTVNTGTAPNAQSLVLMVEYHEFSIIFSGDATGETEARAMANFANGINTTVLTGSHHGADTHGSNGTNNASVNWMEVTDPEIMIYQSGTRFGHPRCTVTDSYDENTVETVQHPFHCGESNGNIFAVRRDESTNEARYATERNGTIILSTDGITDVRISCSMTPECEDRIPL